MIRRFCAYILPVDENSRYQTLASGGGVGRSSGTGANFLARVGGGTVRPALGRVVFVRMESNFRGKEPRGITSTPTLLIRTTRLPRANTVEAPFAETKAISPGASN